MGEVIEVEGSVKNLGYIIDENLSMEKQINQVCSQGYGMLRNLWKISKKVTDRSLRTQLIHSGILSKVDYCNSLYTSLPKTQTKKLQKLINSAVRFIFNIKIRYNSRTDVYEHEHITPYLRQLHFLPIQYRAQFKLCLLTYKSIHNINNSNNSPLYLQELIDLRKPNDNQRLRIDNDKSLLAYKTPYPQEYRNRGFSFASPKHWNRLPASVRESSSVSTFKRHLKTFYFTQWTNSLQSI